MFVPVSKVEFASFCGSDVAIGAPYEATTGVVYIYNGAKTGLHHKYSQRIVGSDIDVGLRAFGYAISRPWDIDGNYYAGEVIHLFTCMCVAIQAFRVLSVVRINIHLAP